VSYRHTQPGTLILALLVPLLVFVVALAYSVGSLWYIYLIAGVLAVVTLMFWSLTVAVDRKSIRLRFGWGPVRKTFDLSGVKSATVVRNKWYWGWGIRYYFRGWLYNVSGLDAVELEMTDGRHYRIGTDEPRALQQAIDRALASRR